MKARDNKNKVELERIEIEHIFDRTELVQYHITFRTTNINIIEDISKFAVTNELITPNNQNILPGKVIKYLDFTDNECVYHIYNISTEYDIRGNFAVSGERWFRATIHLNRIYPIEEERK